MLEIPDRFQSILRAHLPYAESGGLTARDELSALGLDSMGVVRLMVDIENGYALELPDELLDESTFATVGSLWTALSTLMTTRPPDRPRPF
ncbi:phosphopantetheine-binding protein [Nonomuraea sp. SBT364]|uniref:phosphopantetheine-binding protein n=1 Tax=Nonomuraea sp. SBT364 TaxID=1580530 RepID=UPI00066B7C9A|nr:phosphopantetheine-binding protein [Nonomuraea sp. SBT364]